MRSVFTPATGEDGMDCGGTAPALPPLRERGEATMETILIVVVLLFLLGGGGYYWNSRRG